MKKIRNLSMVCVFFIAIAGCSDNEWSAKESDVVSSKTIVVTDLEMDFHSAKRGETAETSRILSTL